MLESLKTFFAETVAAFKPKSVWLLIIPALLLLFITDPALVKTMIQWSAFALVLAGVSIIVSMLVFPQIKLSELVVEAQENECLPSAIVAAALIIFFGILFYSLVFWAKA